MHARLALAAVFATVAGCAGSAPAPAESAPPRAGLERRFFQLASFADPAFKIPIRVDAPPEWGILRERGNVTFRPCSVDAPLFGDLHLGSRACKAKEPEGCLDEIIQPIAAHAGAKTTRSGAHAWVTGDVLEQGRRRVDATYVVAGASGAIVCTAVLRGKDLQRLDAYRAACESIVPEPSGAWKEETAPQPARMGPSDPIASVAPEVASVATAFIDAGRRRDLASAAKLLRSPEVSCTFAPSAATCRAEIEHDRADLPAALASFPKDFEPGLIEADDAFPMPPPLVALRVHSKRDPCSWGVDLLVEVRGGRAAVALRHAPPPPP